MVQRSISRFVTGISLVNLRGGPDNSRSYKVILFDKEGDATFIGCIREATVTVFGKEVSPRAPNPLDDNAYLVRRD